MNTHAAYADILTRFAEEGRLRTLPHAASAPRFDLTSNDYLNLAHSPEPLPEEITSLPVSAAASRLLLTDQTEYRQLEQLLEQLYGRPALLFNSGYHANVGTISALAIPGTVFISDRLIHASMIDGIRLSGARFSRFPHNDVGKLEALVSKESRNADRVIILTESIFSMDGDIAPLRKIIEIKKSYPTALLYVDEAHAFGVRGKRGLGVAEELGIIDDIDILVGTFGKAAASLGAFVSTSREIKDFLVNSARSFIFSTALPPINIAITRHNLARRILPAENLRTNLDRVSAYFREKMSELSGDAQVSQSQIVPLTVGDAAKVVELSARLMEAGILALPIRYPTVAKGTERIRFSMHAGLTIDDIDEIFSLMKKVL